MGHLSRFGGGGIQSIGHMRQAVGIGRVVFCEVISFLVRSTEKRECVAVVGSCVWYR